jgi:FtsP/CotA-like multicopper oxidase with cupredoxin domain
MTLLPFRSILLRFASMLLAGMSMGAELYAQTPSAVPPVTVQPTVTPSMGDVGGKYFGKAPDPAKTRHYYIAAEPELWNYVPEGVDPVCGKALPNSVLLGRASYKIRYVQYADPEFSARVLPSERLGILGPVLRGTTGEYLAVTFLNRSWLPLSMHPHGVDYDKDSEGSYYRPSPGLGAAIAPGAKFTYVWHLDEASGPRANEPSSKAWLYHSHVAGDEETNMGLAGFIVVTDPARARADGTPKDVDREMAALFMIFDESAEPEDGEEASDYPQGAAPAPQPRTWSQSQQMSEEGQRHTINGRAFGNLAGLEMNQGENVRWYLFGLGSENDFHTPHWHGLRVVEDGRRGTDVVELLPGSMKIADMRATKAGTWLFHCHVAEHMGKGMFARFVVHPEGGAGVSRKPEDAFFGMPQSLATLRFQSAEVSNDHSDPAASAIDLEGQVTVPDPCPLLQNAFSLKIGSKTVTLQPDVSGICAAPEGILLVKNTNSSGVVTGGRLDFELTLKGSEWLEELRKLGALKDNGDNKAVPVAFQVGSAHHSASINVTLGSVTR